MWRQHHVAVPEAFALLDDVADFEGDNFGGAQTCAVSHAQRGHVYLSPGAASSRRATSPGLSTTGSFLGFG